MTASKHILRAEELLQGAWHVNPFVDERRFNPGWHDSPTPGELAQAQIHAALAVASELAEVRQVLAEIRELADIHLEAQRLAAESPPEPWYAFLTRRGWWVR